MVEIGELYNARIKISDAIEHYSCLSRNDIINLEHALELIGKVEDRLETVTID